MHEGSVQWDGRLLPVDLLHLYLWAEPANSATPHLPVHHGGANLLNTEEVQHHDSGEWAEDAKCCLQAVQYYEGPQLGLIFENNSIATEASCSNQSTWSWKHQSCHWIQEAFWLQGSQGHQAERWWRDDRKRPVLTHSLTVCYTQLWKPWWLTTGLPRLWREVPEIWESNENRAFFERSGRRIQTDGTADHTNRCNFKQTLAAATQGKADTSIANFLLL